MIYTMMQACRETGMTYQGLKFYCNAGLVPNVKRDSINRRIFDEHDIEWIKSLRKLRRCGMSINDIREYMNLCLEGEASIPERKLILSRTRERLMTQIDELKESISYIDMKQGFYDGVLSGAAQYVSNLLPCSCSMDRQIQ
ncbi:MAG: MerR family transcriptional regulator [Synergistaceae bacterium]|nr:MerR family transcriptional regulator [Synergistaceae bacterium]